MNPHVFVVQHLHVLGGGEEDVKFIGVYSSQHAAQAAVDRLRLQPGFRDTPDGFSIDLYTLDEDNWTAGYMTVPRAGNPDAEWYLAEIVVEFTIEGESDNLVHKNLTLVRADSSEEAYERAIALGAAENMTCSNTDGKRVTSRFVGLKDLNVIHDRLEHGAELIYSKRVGMTPLELEGWVSAKEALGVFRERDEATSE